MPVYPYNGTTPRLGRGAFVAPDAVIVGDVVACDEVSFWFKTVVRGDVHRIRVGERTNVQDGSILHVTHDTHPLEIGVGVVVGHAAVLHGCTVADGVLIGIGARVLDGAVIESGAQIGAGAVVSPGTVIPAGQLALGIPARPVRELSERERALIPEISERYVQLKNAYAELMTTTTVGV